MGIVSRILGGESIDLGGGHSLRPNGVGDCQIYCETTGKSGDTIPIMFASRVGGTCAFCGHNIAQPSD